MKGDKLEALTVCVNYSDYFEHVVEANYRIFDKWVIVTTDDDFGTKALCATYGLSCVVTDVFYKNGASFNKAAGMNEGLKLISSDAFVIFIDADIVLHDLTRHTFDSLKFEKDTLYGCDRLICTGYDKYIKYTKTPGHIMDNWLMHDGGFKWGARICQYYGIIGEEGRFRGWLPLGFFQMVYRGAFTQLPEGSPKADHYDVAFGMQFPRDKRVFIPEIMGIHLESDGHWKGQNWGGRLSPPFISTKTVEVLTPKAALCGKIKKFFKCKTNGNNSI